MLDRDLWQPLQSQHTRVQPGKIRTHLHQTRRSLHLAADSGRSSQINWPKQPGIRTGPAETAEAAEAATLTAETSEAAVLTASQTEMPAQVCEVN